MDLRYSVENEQFRREIRCWLQEAVPAYGEPPPPHDWPARRAYDTGWQRRLYDAGYAGIDWPPEYGGRGAAADRAARLPRGDRRGPARRTSASTSSACMHAGPDAHRRGHRRAAGALTCRASCAARRCGARASPSPARAPTSPSLRTRAVRDGDALRRQRPEDLDHARPVADYCELLVRTDPDAPKHKGITWLILPMHQPGVEMRPIRR